MQYSVKDVPYENLNIFPQLIDNRNNLWRGN